MPKGPRNPPKKKPGEPKGSKGSRGLWGPPRGEWEWHPRGRMGPRPLGGMGPKALVPCSTSLNTLSYYSSSFRFSIPATHRPRLLM